MAGDDTPASSAAAQAALPPPVAAAASGSTSDAGSAPSDAAAPSPAAADSSASASASAAPSSSRPPAWMSDESLRGASASVPPPAAATPVAPSPAPNADASQPALPPREYSRDPRLLQYNAPAPALPVNRTLPRFFRFVAALLFWGGGAVGLSVWLYRRFVLPRMAVLAKGIGSLHQHHLGLFDRMLLSLRAVALDNRAVLPQTAEAIDAQDHARTSAAAGEGKVEVVDEGVQATSASEEGETPVVEEISEPEMFEPLRDSLRQLRNNLSVLHPDPPAAAAAAAARESEAGKRPPAANATQGLLASLEDLSSYISTQQFYTSQSYLSTASGPTYHARTAGAAAGTAVPPALGAQPDVAAQCRSEIRGLKGLLLNRRNFAAFAPPAAS